MPRPHRNLPLGVSNDPVFVTDPVREAELLEEFRKRLAYWKWSYRFAKAHAPDSKRFNASLARLKKQVANPAPPGTPESRAEPELELLISVRARRLAGLDDGTMLEPCHKAFVERAAAEVARTTKARRGQPVAKYLNVHVLALMALVQETCGKPVLDQRDKHSVYEPQFPEGVGQLIELQFADLDSDVSTKQLSHIVRKARKDFNGKLMRFVDFLPGYGARPDPETGAPIVGPHLRLVAFVANAPITFP